MRKIRVGFHAADNPGGILKLPRMDTCQDTRELCRAKGNAMPRFSGKFCVFVVVEYTLRYMRRSIAVLMILTFGSFLAAPLLGLSSDPQSNLPACCRRNGKHHCMMWMMERELGTKQVSVYPAKCPCFPHPWRFTQSQNHATTPSSALIFYAALQSHPACHAQSEVQRRISFDRSRQKRGPPSPVIAS